jgi:hypothetical protein
MRRLTGKRVSCTSRRLTGKQALWLPWPPALLASSPLMAPKPQFNTVFKYKTLIANVLVRTPVCKPTASPGSLVKMCRAGFVQLLIANVLDRTPICKPTASPVSQGKICRAGFVQLFITNILDRTPVCKVRAMVFPSKPRENSPRRICASFQRKRFRLNTACKARLRR